MYMYQLAACLATQVTAWLRSIMTTHSIMGWILLDMRTPYIEASPILPIPGLSNPGLCVLHMCHWCWTVSAGQAAVWRDSV